MAKEDDDFLGSGIDIPHDHDVLSGRGNFVNYHPGNEHFRLLVRKHKVAYVACPKPQKGHFSRLIYNEIKSRNPQGRFLKQNPTTKLWHDIGEKKALDKTRQALREGAPEIQKELTHDDNDFRGMSTEGCTGNDMQSTKHAIPQHHILSMPMNCGSSGNSFQSFPAHAQSQPSYIVPTQIQQQMHIQMQNSAQMSSSGHHQRGFFSPQVAPVAYEQQQFPSQSRTPFHQQGFQQEDYNARIQSQCRNVLNNAASRDRHQKSVPQGSTLSVNHEPRHSSICVETGRPLELSRCASEECDPVAPLPSESNSDFFGSRARKDGLDPYYSSTSSLCVDGVFHQDRSSKSKQGSSQQLLMSLTEDGFQSDLDPSMLSGILNSSLKIGGQSSCRLDKSNSRFDRSNVQNSMEMSLNTIGEFGDSSMAIRMTDSQADMSFANVFDESNVAAGD